MNNTYFIQQEILLMTGTSFLTRSLAEIDQAGELPASADDRDKLNELCYSGILSELLPELYKKQVEGRKLFLWGIMEGNAYLGLDLGESPHARDGYYSIEPYFLLLTQCSN